MNIYNEEHQLELEVQTAKNNLSVHFEGSRAEMISDPMFALYEYIDNIPLTEYEYTVQSSNETRYRYDLLEVNTWLEEADDDTLENIVFKMMVKIMSSPKGINAQGLAGIVFHKTDFEEPQRRLKLAEVFLNAVKESPLVSIKHTKEEIFFVPTVLMNQGMKQAIADLGHPLPMLYPPVVDSNRDIGFQTVKHGMISGGKLKHHDQDICLDHFNRLNQTAYCVELRLGMIIEPMFDSEAKVKDDGTYETQIDISKRFEEFQRMKYELPRKIEIMNKFGNTFYIPHYADSRIRTYAKQHHFNYLGAKFAKGMVQFKSKELVEPEF